ncbi:MAG: hypothetical protein KIA66_00700 [Veillonella sp.]|nr:hypothetical protein [Veillonella sp.]
MMWNKLRALKAYYLYMSSPKGYYEWQYYCKAIGLAVLFMALIMLVMYGLGV